MKRDVEKEANYKHVSDIRKNLERGRKNIWKEAEGEVGFKNKASEVTFRVTSGCRGQKPREREEA